MIPYGFSRRASCICVIALPPLHSAHSEFGSAVIFLISSSELIASSVVSSNAALLAASARALDVRLSDPVSIFFAPALALSPHASGPVQRSAILNSNDQLSARRLTSSTGIIGFAVRSVSILSSAQRRM